MFTDVRVQPAYGLKIMQVTWSLPDIVEGQVFVYRSVTGTGGWEILNQASPVPVQNRAYLDTEYRQKTFNDTPHYRLLLITPAGVHHSSPPVGILEDLTPIEKSGIARMLLNEYRGMRHEGVQILFYFPLYTGTPCPSLDPHSGQKRGFDTCPDVTAETDCYGQPFVGGFQKPIQSRMTFEHLGPVVIAHDGTRKLSSPSLRSVRLPAFPRPRHDCLIVQPRTDDRYTLGEQVEQIAFKGTYPISYRAQLTLLPRSDPRYRVPVPALNKEL